MVDILRYQRQVGVPQGGLAPAGDIAPASDGGMNQALGELASTAQVVNQRAMARKDELDLLNYERQLSEIDTQSMLGDDENPGAMRRMGIDAAGVSETTLESFDDQAGAVQPKLRTPAAQAKAQDMLAVRRQDMHKRLVSHEFAQGQVADQQMTEAALNQYTNEALSNADDPQMVKASLARGMGVIEANGRRMGQAPAYTAGKALEYQSSVMKDVVMSQVTRNPVQAIETYKDNAGAFVGDDRLKVESALQPYILDVQSRSLGDSIWSGGAPSVATGSAAVYNAIAQVESGGRHYDDAGRVILGPQTSQGRAVGQFQIMPATGPEAAKLAGLKWDPNAFKNDPDYNAALGRAYIDQQVKRFGGDMSLVAAAYNMGPEAAEKWAKGQPYTTASGKVWTPSAPRDPAEMPKETRDYIQKVNGRLGGDAPAMKSPPVGLVEAGNVDLYSRPKVKNADGSISTVRSMSFEEDGQEILVPTVSDDGRIMSDEEAIDLYQRTGKHLGKFKDAKSADAYAESLHKDQEKLYVAPMSEASITSREVESIRRADTIQDPRLRQDAINRIQFLASNERKLIQEKDREIQAGKAEFTDRYNNTMARLGAGVDVPVSERPTEAQLVAMYGQYEGEMKHKELQTYAAMAPDISTLNTATNEQAARTIAKYAPNPKSPNFAFDQKVYAGMRNAYANVQEQRNSDPAAFLMAASPTVSTKYADVMAAREKALAATDPASQRAALQSMSEKGQAFTDFLLTEQARMGVPFDKRQVMPKSMAAAVMSDFDERMQSGDVAGAVDRLRATVSMFGDGAAKAIPQLGENAGPTARMALEGIDSRTIQSYVAAASQGDALKKSIPQEDWNLMQDSVRKALGPLDATGTTEWQAYYDITTKLAAGKIKQGIPPDQAAQQAAAETINSRYLFAGQNGGVSYRVPLRSAQGQAINAQKVVTQASGTLSTLRPDQIAITEALPPGISADEYKSYRVRRIQQTGKWLTSRDESGLELSYLDDNGRLVQVRDNQGLPFKRTWDQLQQAPATPALKISPLPGKL